MKNLLSLALGIFLGTLSGLGGSTQTVPQYKLGSLDGTVTFTTNNGANPSLDLSVSFPPSTNSGNWNRFPGTTNSSILNGTGGTATMPNAVVTNLLVLAGITNSLNSQLIAWVASGSYQITTNSFEPTYLTMQTGYVIWPDGNYGAWTNTNTNSTFGIVDGYVITHVASGKTITQATILRNSNGQPTNTPALTVTP